MPKFIRTVVTAGDAANRNNGLPNEEDDYKTRLLKYIPAETVAFYTGAIGVVESLQQSDPGWRIPVWIIVFLIGLIGTPLLLTRIYGMIWKYKKGQIIVSTIAYVLWVLSLGTLQGLDQIPAVVMTLALGIFTFLAPAIADPGTNTSGQAQGRG